MFRVKGFKIPSVSFNFLRFQLLPLRYFPFCILCLCKWFWGGGDCVEIRYRQISGVSNIVTRKWFIILNNSVSIFSSFPFSSYLSHINSFSSYTFCYNFSFGWTYFAILWFYLRIIFCHVFFLYLSIYLSLSLSLSLSDGLHGPDECDGDGGDGHDLSISLSPSLDPFKRILVQHGALSMSLNKGIHTLISHLL